MSSAREVIATQCDGAYAETRADRIISALTAAGYRIIGPDELDDVTVTRCTEPSAQEASEWYNLNIEPRTPGIIAAHHAEQPVTEAMVEAACNAYTQHFSPMGFHANMRHALKAAIDTNQSLPPHAKSDEL